MRARAGVETTIVLLAEPPPWWVAALTLFGALVIQSSIAPLFEFRGGVASAVTLVTMWFALRSGPSGALAFGTFIGAGEDALGTTGAAFTLATAIVATILSRLRARMPIDRPAMLALTIAATTSVRAILVLVIQALEGRPLEDVGTHLHAVIWQTLLTTLVGTALMVAFPRLGGARGRY